MSFSVPVDKIAELSREWNRAEELNKFAERLRGALIVPSINELRYAGRRIIDLLNVESDDEGRAISLISDAVAHCRRAQHDAVDVCVLYMQEYVEKSLADFGLARVLEFNPRLPEFKHRLDEATALIVASREEREWRDDKYLTLAQDLPALVDDFLTLSMPVAAQLRANRVRRFSVVLSWATTLASVVAVSLALRPEFSKGIVPAILSAGTALVGAIAALYFARAADSRPKRPQ